MVSFVNGPREGTRTRRGPGGVALLGAGGASVVVPDGFGAGGDGLQAMGAEAAARTTRSARDSSMGRAYEGRGQTIYVVNARRTRSPRRTPCRRRPRLPCN